MVSACDLVVIPGHCAEGRALLGGAEWRCALGSNGVAVEKREGDGATPVGRFALRRVLYRSDRLTRPQTALPCAALSPSDGWCDAPGDPAYNRAVKLPYPASCESLWRIDAVYDLILAVGHNDCPPAAGAGSAIFVHCARPDYAPTQGCVAFATTDLLDILARLDPGAAADVRAA
jgi:L,D-peptidoglycan transpeptidase YkuD (ErfK/YbiS/YcfS/YnhG family)